MEGPFDFYNAVLGKPLVPKVLFPAPQRWPQLTERCAKHLRGHAHMMGISFRAHQSATPILLCAGSFN